MALYKSLYIMLLWLVTHSLSGAIKVKGARLKIQKAPRRRIVHKYKIIKQRLTEPPHKGKAFLCRAKSAS